LRVRLDQALYRGADAQTLRELASQAAQLVAGARPLAAERGNVLRGYYAANDDSCQPYSLSFPDNYVPGQEYPLILDLHCHGWSDWYRPFQGHPAGSLPWAFVAAPHGRGSCDYLWIAEDDVLAVTDAVCAEFPVDKTRVYVTGWSMGGTGSFHLPSRYPDRFAASYPKAGNADFTAWEEAWREDRRRISTPRDAERMFLRWATVPVTFAENFLHVPVAMDHGALDSINPVAHSRSMAGRLSQLGYLSRLQDGAGGHGWGASFEERAEWMRRFRLPKDPPHVRYRTDDYRHCSAYWVRLDRFAERMKLAELEVRAAAPERLEVARCENLERFTLRLSGLNLAPGAQLLIAGERLALPNPLPPEVTLARATSGRWALATAAAQPGGLFPPPKRKGLEGPIHDAFRDPFLVVIGTTAADPFEGELIRQEAQRWRRQWRRRFQTWPPVKNDSEVTAEDAAARSLLLFGGPQANLLTARLMDRLPLRADGERVVFGGRSCSGPDLGYKLAYPNPEHPDRLVLLMGSTTWRGMWQMTHRFGNWFDWMPLDNRDWYDYCIFDDRSQEFETFLEVGFFDEDWKLDRAKRWAGLAQWREAALPREYPRFVQPPAGSRVRLCDLWPAQIDTAKGPLQINRSLNGKPLCIGRAAQSHGLGQWIESALVYHLGGAYRSFEVNYGIDAEGQEAISTARAATEQPRFEVCGDGRRLAEPKCARFGEAPGRFVVDVTGVQKLTLRVLRTSAEGWLYGPVCWGEAVLKR
jgi:hypothetical protein